jgi:transcriptional regulator with XRE-family HTH domain
MVYLIAFLSVFYRFLGIHVNWHHMTTRIDLSLHTMFGFEQNPFKNQNLPFYPFSISRDENRQPPEDLAKEGEAKFHSGANSAFLITDSRLDMPENEPSKQSRHLIPEASPTAPSKKVGTLCNPEQTSGKLLCILRKQYAPPGAPFLTQKELAKQTGVSIENISSYEADNPIEEDDKIAFAQFFGVSVDAFDSPKDPPVLATKKLFANRLVQLRINYRRGLILSQKELGLRTGIPACTLSKYEGAKRWISETNKVALAQFFNVSPSLFSSPKPLPTEPQVIAGDDRRVTGKKRGRSTGPQETAGEPQIRYPTLG